MHFIRSQRVWHWTEHCTNSAPIQRATVQMSTVNTHLLEVDKISWKGVIKDCSLSISPHSFTVIVGCNGSGKSSLLRCLCGWYPVDSGEVRIKNTPIANLSSKDRASIIGLLPQRIAVSESLPIIEWLSHFRFRFNESKSTTQQKIADILKHSNLEQLSTRTWPQLSGGEAQRIALLGLQLQNTECWLLDEPGNHLDPSVGHQLYRRLVTAWQNGTTIVLVTHNINVLLQHLPTELWSTVQVVGMVDGTIKWTTDMDNEMLPKYLGDLYGLNGQYVRVGNTKQIFYMTEDS